MKALSLHGPWAYYERKNAENESRIAQLERDMKYWQDLATEMQNKLAMESDSVKQLQERALPTLQEENERARGVINSLQEELNTARQGHAEAHKQLSEQVQSLTDDLQRLSADNAVLRSELAKTVHNKQTTNTKLDLIKKKLGLNESEAKVYIQELDDLRSAVKVLKEEVATLTADKASLQAQVDSRSSHCMTLISENKRLLATVSELRQQNSTLREDLSAAKQDLAFAAQQAKARKPLVAKEKPAALSGQHSGSSLSSSKPARPASAGLQSRPAWQENVSAKPTVVAHKKAQQAGGQPVAGIAQVPIGLSMPADTDMAKAEAVRQALALRQQRLSALGASNTNVQAS